MTFTSVSDPHPDPYVLGHLGSAFGSVSQRYGSEDPDPLPDPYQDVTDPQHWFKACILKLTEIPVIRYYGNSLVFTLPVFT
jgi:hypothetical protein